MVTGGEPGGPCISDAHVADVYSTIVTAAEVCGNAWARTTKEWFATTSDDALIAGR